MSKIKKKLQIVVFHWQDEDRKCQRMYLQGLERLSVYDFTDNPEDATIDRDLVSCTQVARLLQEAVKYDEAEYHFIELPCDIDYLPEEEWMRLTAELNWGC